MPSLSGTSVLSTFIHDLISALIFIVLQGGGHYAHCSGKENDAYSQGHGHHVSLTLSSLRMLFPLILVAEKSVALTLFKVQMTDPPFSPLSASSPLISVWPSGTRQPSYISPKVLHSKHSTSVQVKQQLPSLWTQDLLSILLSQQTRQNPPWATSGLSSVTAYVGQFQVSIRAMMPVRWGTCAITPSCIPLTQSQHNLYFLARFEVSSILD